MNYRLILKTLGTILQIESICMLISLLVGLIYGEDPTIFAIVIAVTVAVGTLLSRIKVHVKSFFQRDGIVTVALIWIAMSVVGALPFWLYGHQFGSLASCIFESASGFSTTGSTILTEIESLPKGILFWRSFTHFLGGMGVLVFAIAILPAIGDRAHNLVSAESTGPSPDKLVSNVGTSAKILYAIYVALTLLETIALCICGLSFYDSINTAMATAGTGGFCVLNASVAGFNNLAAEIVITVFMGLFSINFTIFFLLLTKNFRTALMNTEFLFFIALVLSSIGVITANIYKLYGSFGTSLRYSSFQVLSIISTTGFGTADFDTWPMLSKCFIVLLMLIGACAGSTGGGMKCSRVIILFKSLRREVHRIQRPRSVSVITMDGKAIPESVISNTTHFFFAYICVIIFGTILISLEGYDFTTTLSSVITCISNIGPGLNKVGPTCNFAFYSDFSKLVLALIMLAGRLEIFPILLLFSHSTWKRI